MPVNRNMFKYLKILFVINLVLYVNVSLLYCAKDKPARIVSTSSMNRISDNAFPSNNETYPEQILPKIGEIEHAKTPRVGNDIDWNRDDMILLQNVISNILREHENKQCLLSFLTNTLRWWSHGNGTLRETNLKIFRHTMQQLDLSHRNIYTDEEAFAVTTSISPITNIVAFSLAFNEMRTVPFKTLQLMANSLKYLSLKRNFFTPSRFDSDEDTNSYFLRSILKKDTHKAKKQRTNGDYQWAKFPYMPALLELDISACSIEAVSKESFQNLTNLRRLYMSSNRILFMSSQTFYHTPALQALDLSFTNFNIDVILGLQYALHIDEPVFKYLPNLTYLNLSHTKLSSWSTLAFAYIGSNLQYLNLCFTSFPGFAYLIFRNSSIIAMDLSGNENIAFSITEDVFEGLWKSLKYLILENANIKDLAWVKPFRNLRLLALANNNIKTLSVDDFRGLHNLQVLDLTSNQVSNWYSQVFVHNKKLRLLSLNGNNINMITPEMLKDFSILHYLTLGNNNFICDCMLRDLIDIAAANNQQAVCNAINFTMLKPIWQDAKLFVNSILSDLDIPSGIALQYFQKLKGALNKFANTQFESKKKINFTLKALKSYAASRICLRQNNFTKTTNSTVNGSLNKLQLLDYQEDGYYCFNDTKKFYIVGLNCERSTYSTDIQQQLKTLNTCVMASLGSVIVATTLGILIYVKRWHIYYYYSSFKSATLLSTISKDRFRKLHRLSGQNPHMLYDIFISYCESDRDWIVEELIPNLEGSGDMSICLHERDFEVGITILDNIVSCMERSKALLLVMSPNFLLSHWCQFEMQLAQYQVLDYSKEHLILILLEDIPRSKRPRILRILMKVHTYIKWPGGKNKNNVHSEERKLFWKRLQRTLRNIGLKPSAYQD